MCYVDTDSYLDQLADQYWGDDFILVEDHKCECCDSIVDLEVSDEGTAECPECGHEEYFKELDNDLDSYYYEDQRD